MPIHIYVYTMCACQNRTFYLLNTYIHIVVQLEAQVEGLGLFLNPHVMQMGIARWMG